MTIPQLSVFVENNPGALSRITSVLAEHNVDIRAMSLAETQNFGVLRLIVNDPVVAGEALEKNNIVFHFTKVIAASIPDEPGGLAGILSILAEENINIAYMYAFIAVSGNQAAVVLRIHSSTREKAIKVLTDHGVRIFAENEIQDI